MKHVLVTFLFLIAVIPLAQAQKRQVSGKITAFETGSGMPGVTVLIKGTTQGVVTDTSGVYSIAAENTNTLVYSFIGYNAEERTVGNLETIDVELLPDISTLQEIVVVGYGTQKRSDLTGSIASISTKEIKSSPATTFDQLIQGRASGVQVIQNSSAPGGAVSIMIRGGNSLTAGNAPLYVIDGFPVYNNDKDATSRRLSDIGQPQNALSAVNPNDIESIEILKDASATSIYGARGANGVVLITTKRGKVGEPRVEFESYYGMQNVIRTLPVLNASQYAQLVNDANMNDGKPAVFSNPDSLGAGTNWQKEIFRKAPIQNYYLAISGGDDNTRYTISGGYFNQNGVVRGSDFQRYSFRANLDRKVNDKVTIGNNLTISRTFSNKTIASTDGGPSATVNTGSIYAALMFSPTVPIRDSIGKYSNNTVPGALQIDNPLALANETTEEITTTRALGSVFADYAILKNLNFKSSFGADIAYTKENSYYPSTIQSAAASFGLAGIGVVQNTTWLNENTLSFNHTFKERHAFTALAGYTMQSSKLERVYTSGSGFISDQLKYNNLGLGNPSRSASSARKWALNSFLSRATYNLDGKYLFMGTVRADGSSKLGANNKYSVFPSASAAWRVSEESFLKGSKWLSDLKIRASYGLSGNQEVPEYQSLDSLASQNYVFGSVYSYRGVGPSRIGNPDIKWETTAQFDAGVDVGFFQNRVVATADYYIKRTRDLLLEEELPTTSGYERVVRNIGSNQNKGVELSLYTYNLVNKFKWNTIFNISANRNEILDLGQVTEFTAGRGSNFLNVPTTGIVRVGQPVGLFYGLVSDGVFKDESAVLAHSYVDAAGETKLIQPDAKPGDERFVDTNQDGVITSSDRTIIGKAQPKYIFGFTNNFSYQGFEVNIFIQSVQGAQILNMNRFELESLTGTTNQSTAVLNRWTPEHMDTNIPRATTSHATLLSNRFVEDGSYIRVKNISLAYNLPTSLIKGKVFKTAKVYISGQNLFTITNYTGYDPDVNSFASYNLTLGTDYGSYPNAKSYRVGVNLSF
jgi:TonB-linked SusC/RagA family outer membrane protein